MYVDVEANENTDKNFSMLYRDISKSREIYCIKYSIYDIIKSQGAVNVSMSVVS